jgi:copper chaperone CopZ
MRRATTTMFLNDLGCAGGSALSLARELERLPGITRVYVNPVTETAYLEFDADRCSEADIVRAAEPLGIHAVPAKHP